MRIKAKINGHVHVSVFSCALRKSRANASNFDLFIALFVMVVQSNNLWVWFYIALLNL